MPGEKEKFPSRRLVLGPYRGEVGAGFDDPLFIDFIARPEEVLARPESELLFEGRNRVGAVRVVLSSGMSRDLVVKEFSPKGFIRLKSLVQPSKAAKAWRGALALEERSLGTASPAAYLEAEAWPGRALLLLRDSGGRGRGGPGPFPEASGGRARPSPRRPGRLPQAVP